MRKTAAFATITSSLLFVLALASATRTNAQVVVGIGSDPGVNCTYYAKVFWGANCLIGTIGDGSSAEFPVPAGGSASYTLPTGKTLKKLELRRQPGLINPVTWICNTGWTVTQNNGSCAGGPPALHFQKHPSSFNFRIYP